MTEDTGFAPQDPAGPFPPAPVPPEQQIPHDQATAAAGEQLAAQAATAPAADAGLTVEQIRSQAQREVLLPMESKINDLIEEFRARSSTQDAQIQALRAQLAAAQASVGPPDVIRYAQAVHERLQTAAATAGLPGQHWAGVLSTAEQLAAAANDAAQSGDGAKLPALIGQVERFVTRTHPRTSTTVIEHFPALLGDLEELAAALEHLAAPADWPPAAQASPPTAAAPVPAAAGGADIAAVVTRAVAEALAAHSQPPA